MINKLASSRLVNSNNKVKNFIKHYYIGTAKLFNDTFKSYNLIKCWINGNSFTIHDVDHLRRNRSDLIKLIPFTGLIIVPFMEFLIPPIIWYFPNFLPSTFETSLQKKVRLEKIRNRNQILMDKIWRSSNFELKKRIQLEGSKLLVDNNEDGILKKAKSVNNLIRNDLFIANYKPSIKERWEISKIFGINSFLCKSKLEKNFFKMADRDKKLYNDLKRGNYVSWDLDNESAIRGIKNSFNYFNIWMKVGQNANPIPSIISRAGIFRSMRN